jgi:hypothetical protein
MGKPLDLIQYQILFLNICLQTFTTCYIYSLNIALSNARSQPLGKPILQYYYTKKATPPYSPTIDQLPLQYYMTARKAFMLNAALLDNSKLLLVPLKMLKSPTKTYIFFILTSKTLLDPLIMPNYSPL